MTRCLPVLTIAGLMTLVTFVIDPAKAQPRHVAADDEFLLARPAGTPVMAVVGLTEQRVTIYDAEGKTLRASVSTGQTGYETPAGIYSVIQKEAEHYSNLYDDASMPFMQRITWSGIALHAGALPGHPASHGCVRMPYEFAERLFDVTKIGLRVIVVRNDISPVDISHPALFTPGPIQSEVGLTTQDTDRSAVGRRPGVPAPADMARPQTWRSIAAATSAAAEVAAKKAEDARKVATQKYKEASKFIIGGLLAEGAIKRAKAKLDEAERILGSDAGAPTEPAEQAKAKALEQISAAQKKLDAIRTEGQPQIDAAVAAREEYKAAEAERVAAEEEVKLVESKMVPISVLISRKTQRLYVRQAFKPIFETGVTIQKPDDPIGTTLYIALNYMPDDMGLRWSALAMYPIPKAARARGRGESHAESAMTDVAMAKAALERISIPQEVLNRFSEFVSPGSSLIITDEDVSRETGKDTDFIVLMSGEPQGGLKIRQRNPYSAYDRTYGREPYFGRNPSSWW
jgi:hypothetical protein